MSPHDFFYWLQGFFELTGPESQALTDQQLNCIVSHIDLVRAHGTLDERTIKISMVIDGIIAGWIDRSRGTKAVVDLVAQQFAHVIDPKAGGPERQEHLNAIHNLGRIVDPKTGAKARC